MKKLLLPTLQTFLTGAILLGLLLFPAAGTLRYWQAWLFIAVFMSSVSAIGVYLSLHDPALLERRKRVGPAAEQSPIQRIIMTIAFASLLGLLLYSGFAQRSGWTPVPAWVSLLGSGLVALGLVLNLLVFKANSFGGSTVQTYEEQRLVTSGPYAIVRHPMYGGVLVMLVGVPLALGAWGGLLILAVALPGLVYRILDEEKLLRKELPGYDEYAQKTPYRLLPYIW